MKEKKLDYGNWVPGNMMHLLWGITALLAIANILNFCIFTNIAADVILLCMLLLSTGMSVYMQICRNIFAYEKGGLMGRIHDYLLEHLYWNGEGDLLEIGCGAGALSIKCAKKYPRARITGMDYWGKSWNYAREQCENNAELEGVKNRITFQQGDAAKLDFPDNTFHAAVSNFVFHEVKSQPDKHYVVREALRVVKKGGVFVFHDMFEQTQLYGNMNDFIKELKQEGITEIHYIPNTDRESFIPGFLRAPWMLKDMGLIYGIK